MTIIRLAMERIPAEFIAAIDAWAEANDVSRSEAIRRLVEFTLTTKPADAPADAEFMAAVDAWADANDVRRVDAIRRLVEIGLGAGRSEPVGTRLRDVPH
jgi:metal-responsive CopG/Arc/MetJ family transcriptional regulator